MQENIRQDLLTFVPISVLNEVQCFVFYDNHPRDDRTIDVLVCTQRKEVIEYYNREPISSLLLHTSQNFIEVRSFRNVKCKLFYFVATEDELFILSSNNDLVLEHIVTEVDSYEVYDSSCTGVASLKVKCKDDAVPLFFDDNFSVISERCVDMENVADNMTPIIMQLTRKLKEAKYNVKCNENKYNEFLNLRQVATFYLFQKMSPNLNESLFNINSKEIASSMDLKTWTPWIKLCNRKIVIAFNLRNNNKVPLEEVHVLLNSTTKNSLVYVTKLFQRYQTHWIESEEQQINANTIVAVVTCMDVKELQHNVTSSIKFDMVLAFKMSERYYLLPFEKVSISASDIMGEEFDILAKPHEDEEHTFLSILATSEKITLCLRPLINKGEPSITAADVFCEHLKMEEFNTIENVVIHRTSPYHMLHGIMVIYENSKQESRGNLTVEVHSRYQSQVAALIHYMNDVIPFRMVATTPNYKITANAQHLTHYNEVIPDVSDQGVDYLQFGKSALIQTSMLLAYLDDCMIQMNESKNQAITNKVGSEIDMFACGLDKFMEFRNKLLKEVYSGIQKGLETKSDMAIKDDSNEMIIDED